MFISFTPLLKALPCLIAAKSTPKSLHYLAMQLIGERIEHPEKYRDDEPKLEFEDPKLYHYAIFSDNVNAVSVVVNSIVTNAEEQRKHVKAVKEYTFFNSSYVPVLRQLESAKLQKFYFENEEENTKKEENNNIQFRKPKYLSMLNHLRFYLPKMYPKLHRILFLDDDVVVKKDLTTPWEVDMDGKVIGAVETCFGLFNRYARYLNFSHHLIRDRFNQKACVWSFGMNMFDLDAWRCERLTDEYHYWHDLTQAALQPKPGTFNDIQSCCKFSLAETITLPGYNHLCGQQWMESTKSPIFKEPADAIELFCNISLLMQLYMYIWVRPNELLAVFKGATQVGSIVAGGCYDNLIGMFGIKRVAGIGVGLGIKRVFTIIEQNQKDNK
ncbi:probable galacturonosyltransferase 9 [Tanacetum coccineum]|uniref:Hexosyltransferase n=2 Tax=Tanacetum coccineum TaxID=301880 RepID=A0ABQ5IFM2_9ASTR